jgi:hypothetical protein
MIERLRSIEAAITGDADVKTIEELFREAFTFQAESRPLIDNLLALYLVRIYREGKMQEASSFIKCNVDAASLKRVADKIKVYDLGYAQAFMLDFLPDEEQIMAEILSDIEKHRDVIVAMESDQLQVYSRIVCSALHERFQNNEAEKGGAIQQIRQAIAGCEEKDNVYEVLDSLRYVLKQGKMKLMASADNKTNTITLMVVSAVAVISMVLALLFAFNVFGGNSGSGDNGDSETTVSITEPADTDPTTTVGDTN